jgi:hypothetical protein
MDRGGIEPPTPGFSGDYLSIDKCEFHSAIPVLFAIIAAYSGIATNCKQLQ